MMLIFLLFWLSLPITSAAPNLRKAPTEAPILVTAPPTEARSHFAMLDDVRLLANGLLQLGQSLREFVHKTKSQINDIFQKLNIFDRSFYQLSVVTSEIKEEEEKLKETTIYLKANNEEIRNLSLEINSKINNILQERSQLHSKVGGLEEKLKGLSKSIIPLEQLQEITALKLNYDSFQDTAEKLLDLNPETPDPFRYLKINSTDGTAEINDFPKDCSDVFKRGQRTSGIYPIKPNQSEPFYVYCEISADGVATVIQRREDGSVDFDQSWEKYEYGFGKLEKEFWLGLAKIHSIAQQGQYILHIELEDWKEEKRFIEYTFTLEGPASDYALHVAPLSGDLPDAMSNHTGMKFSTKDRDNDNHDESNCARNYTGGWWFDACGDTNLNGRYTWIRLRARHQRRKGIYWRPAKGSSYTLKSTKITIRPSTQFQ
uniref:Angiopoietin-related protein 3 n=1 Tax=Cyprinus carpio carpio TaxID=630221 RepID=A0A8C1HLF8_CYPCA